MVGENRRVQHLIREALDAKESVELQAAIMAAEKYAAKSKLDFINLPISDFTDWGTICLMDLLLLVII